MDSANISYLIFVGFVGLVLLLTLLPSPVPPQDGCPTLYPTEDIAYVRFLYNPSIVEYTNTLPPSLTPSLQLLSASTPCSLQNASNLFNSFFQWDRLVLLNNSNSPYRHAIPQHNFDNEGIRTFAVDVNYQLDACLECTLDIPFVSLNPFGNVSASTLTMPTSNGYSTFYPEGSGYPYPNVEYIRFPVPYGLGTFYIYSNYNPYLNLSTLSSYVKSHPKECNDANSPNGDGMYFPFYLSLLIASIPMDSAISEQGYFTYKLSPIVYVTHDKKNSLFNNTIVGVNSEFNVDEDGNDIYVPIYLCFGSIGAVLLVGWMLTTGREKCVEWSHQREDWDGQKDGDGNVTLDGRGEEYVGLDYRPLSGPRAVAGLSSAPSSSVAHGDLNVNSDSIVRRVMSPTTVTAPSKGPKKDRIRAIDTFRGISLSIMIFVNAGGGSYSITDHSAWNGLHLADLVFPWFIWLMGFSMALSFHSTMKKVNAGEMLRVDVIGKILQRSATLGFLSLMVSNGDQPINTMRIPGVLMRFAVSYLVVGLIIVCVPKRRSNGESDELNNPGFFSKLKDLSENVYEYLVMAILILIWLLLTFTLNVPGCPTGYIGPGGSYVRDGTIKDCTGGSARYIDVTLLGVNHMYGSPTPQAIYNTDAYDPEGILGCITSCFMVYMGLMGGRIITNYKSHRTRLLRWFAYAIIFGVVAIGLSGGTQNDGAIPLNKNMWSLSFVTGLSGWAFLNVCFLYILMDIALLWGGSPFMAMGMNSIIVYCGSEFYGGIPFRFSLPNDSNGCPVNSSHSFDLFSNVFFVFCWICIANLLHHHKMYFNV